METKVGYDAVISWGLIEELVAGIVFGAENVVLKPKDAIPADVIECLSGKRLLICGSYFTPESVATLRTRAQVDVMVFSEKDLTKYPDAKLFELKGASPWVQHILRRTRPGELPEDEAFYRGLLMVGAERGFNLEQTLRAMFSEELKVAQFSTKVDEKYTGLEADLIRMGSLILQVDEYRAKENAELTGLLFQLGPYKARIVSASVIPVMPTVMAAAKGVDIGISERYNQKEGVTQVTFYTYTPSKVDLSFVNKAPIEGGGRPDCKGKTFRGRVDVLALCKQITW